MLYGLSLLLLGALIAFALRLRSRAEHVRRRAALEHLIAQISTQLVGARLYQIAGDIEKALSELAGRIGADRAYLVTQGASARIYSWCRENVSVPGDWPEAVRRAAAELEPRGGGVIHVPDVSRLLSGRARDFFATAGIRSLACATAPDGQYGSLFLGFEALSPRAMTAADEVSLLRVALDAIGGRAPPADARSRT